MSLRDQMAAAFAIQMAEKLSLSGMKHKNAELMADTLDYGFKAGWDAAIGYVEHTHSMERAREAMAKLEKEEKS